LKRHGKYGVNATRPNDNEYGTSTEQNEY